MENVKEIIKTVHGVMKSIERQMLGFSIEDKIIEKNLRYLEKKSDKSETIIDKISYYDEKFEETSTSQEEALNRSSEEFIRNIHKTQDLVKQHNEIVGVNKETEELTLIDGTKLSDYLKQRDIDRAVRKEDAERLDESYNNLLAKIQELKDMSFDEEIEQIKENHKEEYEKINEDYRKLITEYSDLSEE